jgi:hypothetical protein
MRTSCTSPRELGNLSFSHLFYELLGMPNRLTFDSSSETERSLKEVEDAYIRKKEAHDAQRVLPHRSLEDKLTILHQEFDARVNAEVALQV